VRPLVRINVSVIVEQDGRREQGYAGAGGRITLPELTEGRQTHRSSRVKRCGRHW
jgi:TldD protein